MTPQTAALAEDKQSRISLGPSDRVPKVRDPTPNLKG